VIKGLFSQIKRKEGVEKSKVIALNNGLKPVVHILKVPLKLAEKKFQNKNPLFHFSEKGGADD